MKGTNYWKYNVKQRKYNLYYTFQQGAKCYSFSVSVKRKSSRLADQFRGALYFKVKMSQNCGEIQTFLISSVKNVRFSDNLAPLLLRSISFDLYKLYSGKVRHI
jgi:hypothetical protein